MSDVTITPAQITHIDGIEIIAREQAVGPHPRWGMQRPATYKDILRLLLADDSERFMCNTCTLVDPLFMAIRGHIGSHRRTPKPITSEKTLRVMMVEVAKAQRTHGRARYAGPAAEALNRLGTESASGTPWTAAKVSSLYNAYKDKIHVRLPAAAAAEPKTRTGRRLPRPRQSSTGSEVIDALVGLQDLLREASRQVEQLARDYRIPDPELVEKARKYDEMVQRLLG